MPSHDPMNVDEKRQELADWVEFLQPGMPEGVKLSWDLATDRILARYTRPSGAIAYFANAARKREVVRKWSYPKRVMAYVVKRAMKERGIDVNRYTT